MGIQDRDYYHEHRDRQEGRKKPRSGPAQTQDMGEPFRHAINGRKPAKPAPMWMVVLAIAFVILIAALVMNLLLRFLR